MRIGFVGTGTLSEAVIDGLIEAHGALLDVWVSPRSVTVSEGLAAKYPENVKRADSNQSVLDACSIVVLGMRPQQLDAALAELEFREDHTVVSFVAGAENERVAALARPASRVIRVTPLPPIAKRIGPIVVFPAAPDIEELMAPLGDVIVPESQDQVMALGYAGGLMASYFAMSIAAIDWLERESLSREIGQAYLFSMFSALAETGRNVATESLESLPGEYSTKGGINERCLAHLREQKWLETYVSGLEAMKTHLQNLPK